MDLKRLKIGDLIETTGLLGNVSDEQTVLQVVKVHDSAGKREVVFDATYYGVHIGTVTATAHGSGDKIEWSWK